MIKPIKNSIRFGRWRRTALLVVLGTFFVSYLLVALAIEEWSFWEVVKSDSPSFFAVWQATGILLAIASFVQGIYSVQKASYSEANKRYKEFLQISMELEEDSFVGFPIAEVDKFTIRGGTVKSLVAYDLLFSLCEYAYALYGSKPEDWERWEKWLKNFFENDPSSYLAWTIASPYYERPFATQVDSTIIGGRRQLDKISQREWMQANPEDGSLVVRGEFELEIMGVKVMEDWQTPLMNKIGEEIGKECGSVLEIGFGLGICSGRIQEYSPDLHVVIESNAFLAQKAMSRYKDAIESGRVIVFEGAWEDVCKDLIGKEKKFDGIVFDTFPILINENSKTELEFLTFAAKLVGSKGKISLYSNCARSLPAMFQTEAFRLLPGCTIRTQQLSVSPREEDKLWSHPAILYVELRV